MDYISKFILDRKQLVRNNKGQWGKIKKVENDELPIIEIPSPQLLAGFAGYLKYQCSGKIFYRGEKHFHDTTISSLFRSVKATDEINSRKIAFDELVKSLPVLYKPRRFTKDFSPLLQHYGINTDWLDLVDNIFVALWFSNHESTEEYSYVKFFIESVNNSSLKIIDLRTEHTSLSMRAHCQHGFSATKCVKKWTLENIDFNSNLVAIAKLPNNDEMKMSGYIFSNAYMFPDYEIDNTLKLLKHDKFRKKLLDIASTFCLDPDVLGDIH